MIKRIILVVIVLIAGVFAMKNESYQVQTKDEKIIPQHVNYQGYLTNSVGNPITDPSLSMTFKIYDDEFAGVVQWTDTKTVSVENGIFKVVLAVSSDVFTPGAQRWLELVIGGEALTPRTEITAVGFSYKTIDADKLQGLAPSEFVKIGDGAGGDLNGDYPNPIVANNVITSEKIQDGQVQTSDIADNNVTLPKIDPSTSAAGQVLTSNGSSVSPAWQGISSTSHNHSLTHTGDVTGIGSVSGTWGLTIANDAVNSTKILDGSIRGTDIAKPCTLLASVSDPNAVLNIKNTGNGNGIIINNSAGWDGIRINHADNGIEVDSVSSVGFGVHYAGAHGFWVDSAGGDGVFINRANAIGVFVDTAGIFGLRVVKAGTNGVDIGHAGSRGISINQSDGDGLYINSSGDNGVRIDSAPRNGIHIKNTGMNGLYIDNARTNGVDISYASNQGIIVEHAGDNGVRVLLSGWNGIQLDSTSYDGIHIDRAGVDGIRIENANDEGIRIYRAGYNGVEIDNAIHDALNIDCAGSSGVYVDSANQGIYVARANQQGVYAFGRNCGGQFRALGASAVGLYANAYNNLASDTAIYAYGKGLSTGGWSTATKDGEAPCIVSPERTIIAYGTSTLNNGIADIKFDQIFSSNIKTGIPIRVNITPKGKPAGFVYVTETNSTGFKVGLEQVPGLEKNATDISFDWIAIGIMKEPETTPEAKVEWQKAIQEKQQRRGEDVERDRLRETKFENR